MKRFKIIDVAVSIGLLVSLTIINIIYGTGYLDETLLISYLVLGGWQIISMLVHALSGFFTQKWGARIVYHWISFIALVTMPAGSVWILSFAAPFMAVFYTYMCYRETFIKMKRPMDLLK